MYNTHARAHVSRFTCYYCVTCDLRRSFRGMVCLMSSLFLSCIFYWLILSHIDCHINHDWLHVERLQGAVPEIWADRIWDGLGPSIYTGTSCIREFSNGSFDSLKTGSLSAPLFLCLAVPSFAVQRIEGERCLRIDAGDLRPGAGESGFWEVRSHDRSHSSFRVFFIDDFFIYSCTGSTVSRSPFYSWYNGDLMDIYVVYLSRLCCFLWFDLNLCSTSVVYVNC
jgi:hypothetical protein